MGVVHPGEVKQRRSAIDDGVFVEKHPDARLFQVRNHGDGVVIAEHRVDIAAHCFTKTGESFESKFAIAESAAAIVSRQRTQIIVDITHHFVDPLQGGSAHVRVQVAKMQNCEAVKSLR